MPALVPCRKSGRTPWMSARCPVWRAASSACMLGKPTTNGRPSCSDTPHRGFASRGTNPLEFLAPDRHHAAAWLIVGAEVVLLRFAVHRVHDQPSQVVVCGA